VWRLAEFKFRGTSKVTCAMGACSTAREAGRTGLRVEKANAGGGMHDAGIARGLVCQEGQGAGRGAFIAALPKKRSAELPWVEVSAVMLGRIMSGIRPRYRLAASHPVAVRRFSGDSSQQQAPSRVRISAFAVFGYSAAKRSRSRGRNRGADGAKPLS